MESYSILMVDDERFVVDWLSGLLETRLEGEHSFYRAYNAAHALEVIERTRIDLMITDINMPGMSGLELIEAVGKLWPMSKCIVLTGYAEFEYAKSAISKGVISYLLKTSPDDAIVEEVNKALATIEETIRSRSLLSHMQNDLDNHLAQLKRQIFFTWIRGNHQNEGELMHFRNMLGFTRDDGCYYLLMGKTKACDEKPAKPFLADSIVYFRVKTIINQYLNPYVEKYASELANTRIIWILQPNSTSEQHFDQMIMGVLEIAQRSCREIAGMSVSFILGSRVCNPADLSEQYISLDGILDTLPQDGELVRLKEKSLLPVEPVEKIGFTPYKMNVSASMSKLLNDGARAEYFNALDAICANISENTNWQNSRIVHLYFSVTQAIMETINRNGLSETEFAKDAVQELYYPAPAASFDILKRRLYKLSEALFALGDESRSGSTESIVRSIQGYIEQHVSEDISLADLSELTGYSSAYISRVFSKTTGVTISSYIAQQKIAYIKSLMLDRSLTVADIAVASGFHSRTYFNSFFKRNVGMAPQSFRDSLTAGVSSQTKNRPS